MRLSTFVIAFAASLSAAGVGSAQTPDWQRTNPDFPIYIPTGDNDGTNQMTIAAETPDGTWLSTATLSSTEGAADQRVAVFRSTDRGQSWSEPIVLDQQTAGNGHRASWAVPFVVPDNGSPAAGRTYVFYNKNTGSDNGYLREDITGEMRYKWSDDNGQTWHGGDTALPVDMGQFHTNDSPDPSWIGVWKPTITQQNNVLFPFARYRNIGAGGGNNGNGWETETTFQRFDNILTEGDPTQLQTTTLPSSGPGLRVGQPGGGVFSKEPAMVELSDGRLFTTLRTKTDALYWSVSENQGQSWSDPRPLRYQDGGEIVQHPNAPAPMTKLEDGSIVLMYYNQPQSSTFGPRDPAYITIGQEDLDGGQPVEFGDPKKFMDINGEKPDPAQGTPTSYAQAAAYSSFLESQNELYLFYPDSKYYLLGKKVQQQFLQFEDRPEPPVTVGVQFSFEDQSLAVDGFNTNTPEGWTGGGNSSRGLIGKDFANAPPGSVQAVPAATDGQRLMWLTASDNADQPTYFDKILSFGEGGVEHYESLTVLADIGNIDRVDDSGDGDSLLTFGIGYQTLNGYNFLSSTDIALDQIGEGQTLQDLTAILDLSELVPQMLEEPLSMRFQLTNTASAASQVVIDNVRLNGVAVPSPSAFELGLVGITLLVSGRRRRRAL